MATMTTAQRVAELSRKASLGIKPTDSRNTAQYNNIVRSANSVGHSTAPSGAPRIGPSPGSSGSSGAISTGSGSVYRSAIGSAAAPVEQNPMNQFIDPVNQQYNQELAKIKAARESSIGDINQKKQALEPQYTALKNQADVNNAAAVNKLRELIASQGNSNGGDNVTGMTALRVARENAINGYNLQQQQETNAYDKSIADLNNGADIAQVEAERSKALIDAQNNARSYLQQQQNNTLNQQTLDETVRHNKAGEGNVAAGNQVDFMKALATVQQDKFNNAWKTAENFKYVTPELSSIIGVKVGTPLYNAVKDAQQYQLQLDRLKVSQQSVNQTGAYQQGQLKLGAQRNVISASKKRGSGSSGGLSTYQLNQFRQTAIKQLAEQFGNKTYDATTKTYIPANPKYVWGNMSAQQKADLINRRTQQLAGTGQTTTRRTVTKKKVTSPAISYNKYTK